MKNLEKTMKKKGKIMKHRKTMNNNNNENNKEHNETQ